MPVAVGAAQGFVVVLTIVFVLVCIGTVLRILRW